jgi:SAM-dependent methyltransferase
MYKCKICGSYLSTSRKDSLTVNGVPENTFYFSENTVDLHVADCKVCGAVQLFNVPLSSDYNVVYRSIGISVSYREEKKRQIEKFVETHRLSDASMIEVGCGNGQFLEIFREIGITNIIGTESGQDNYNECLNNKFNVIYGDLASITKKEHLSRRYDAFATFHYLEHMPDPIKFVKCLHRILRPGGVGLIEVPNYDFTEKKGIWLEFTRDHRFYYRKKTMCYLMSKCGFSIDSVEDNNGGICLTAVVRKPEINDSKFSLMKNRIKRDIDKFKILVDSFHGSFSVYGAGHYSQLMLNMASKQYGIKPKHIFDSNRKKCGSKICDIVIEHGENVPKVNDCENIIIICAVYNDEVYNMLSGSGKYLVKWE